MKEDQVHSLATVGSILLVPGDHERDTDWYDGVETRLVDGRTSWVRAARDSNGRGDGKEAGEDGKGRHSCREVVLVQGRLRNYDKILGA